MQLDLSDSSDKSEIGLKTTESNINTSLLFHDYIGPVVTENLPTKIDKCEATITIATTSVSTQTDFDDVMTCTANIHTQTDIHQTSEMGCQVDRPVLTFEDIQDSDEKVMFYTGIPNAGTFCALFDELDDFQENTQRQRTGSGESSDGGRPRLLRPIDEFFLVLMRLRLGLLLEDLAFRFCISKSTCSSIVDVWIDYLSVKLDFLVSWPSREIVNETMPSQFQEKHSDCRVIIDCTEINTETPQSLANKSLMYSNYKSHMTWKALLGISPCGMITFTSDLWAGSISDKQLTSKCGILELCEEGDSIMADKGFLISDLITHRGIKLVMPPFKSRDRQFTRREVEETRRIANLRIHVERAMERVKNFRIIQGVMPITLARKASKTWKLCCGLSNLQPPLVHCPKED